MHKNLAVTNNKPQVHKRQIYLGDWWQTLLRFSTLVVRILSLLIRRSSVAHAFFFLPGFSAFLLCFGFSPALLSASELPRVFYLNSYHAGYASSDEIMGAIHQGLTNKVTLGVHFLDSKRQSSVDAIHSNAASALRIIRAFKPDLLIVSDDDAVKHVVEPHFKHGPIPVVFCGVNWSCAQYGLPTTNITGMIETVPLETAIRAIRREYPSLKKLATLSEDSTSERSNRELLDPLYRRLGLEPDYMLVSDFSTWKTAFVKAHADADLIYLPTNGAVRDWDNDAAADFVRKHLRKPVITCDDFMMPYCVLGVTKIPREQGDWAARAALGILSGKPPSDFAVATNTLSRLFLNKLLAERLAQATAHAAARNNKASAPVFAERNGLVVLEAEHFTGMTHSNSWSTVPGLSHKAIKVGDGPWSRHLRYDIQFQNVGLYRLYVLGRKNPLAAQYAGNDLKVFLYPNEIVDPKIAPGHALFEIGFGEQKHFGWRGTPKSKTATTTDLIVLRPGIYRLYIVGGAGEESGWEIDRLLLTQDDQQPPTGTEVGPPESAKNLHTPTSSQKPIRVSLDFSSLTYQLDGPEGASTCQFHSVKADGSAAVGNVAYSPMAGFPDDSPSTEFGKFCDTAFSTNGMALSQHWVTPCPIQTPPGSVGDHYASESWGKLDFSMYEANVLPTNRFYNSHGKEAGPVRGHTVPMLMASLRRARAEGTRVSYWTDVHTDFPPWMWKDGLRKNPVREEMFEEAALHTVYFVKYLTAKHGIPVHAASFINEPDLPGRHRFTPEQQLRAAKVLRECLDEAGLTGVRVLPCTAVSLSKVRLDWAKAEPDTLKELVALLEGPMKDYAPYVDIIGGHGSQSEFPIQQRPKNTTFWRASGDFNEHWTNSVGFEMGPAEMLDEVIRHNTWLYAQRVAQCGIWQIASRMGIGGDFFRMPETFDRSQFGRREAIEGAAAVYPFVRPGMWVVKGSLGAAAKEPYSVDGFAGPGQRAAIVISNDAEERSFRIGLAGLQAKRFLAYQATPGQARQFLNTICADSSFLDVRVPANSVTTLVAARPDSLKQITIVVKDAAHPPSSLDALLAAVSPNYSVRVVSQQLTQREQDSLATKRHPVNPFGSAAFIITDSVDRRDAILAYRTVMAPVIALGAANAHLLGVKIGQRIPGGGFLAARDELDPPAALLDSGLPRACGPRAALLPTSKKRQLLRTLSWAVSGQEQHAK